MDLDDLEREYQEKQAEKQRKALNTNTCGNGQYRCGNSLQSKSALDQMEEWEQLEEAYMSLGMGFFRSSDFHR